MSHIATIQSSTNDAACHYLRRAFTVAQFYRLPMALRIKELRIDRGWTQAELASRAGVSRSQLAMIEAETRPVNTLRLNAIAAALGVKPEALFSKSNENQALLDLLARISPEDRAALVRMAEALAAKAG